MQRAVIYGQEVCMQGSPYTLLVYRRAFGADLMRDIVEAYGEAPLDGSEDEGQAPAMSVFLQVAWAMARTHSDDVPDYPDWLRAFDPREFSLGDGAALEVIDSAIAAELFRARKAGRARRWATRLLERLAQLAGALADRLRAR